MFFNILRLGFRVFCWARAGAPTYTGFQDISPYSGLFGFFVIKLMVVFKDAIAKTMTLPEKLAFVWREMKAMRLRIRVDWRDEDSHN